MIRTRRNPARLGDTALPQSYRRRLERYRYGPGSFKLDLALDGPIPWSDPNVNLASTVHVGGTMAEIAQAELDVWEGRHPDKPFVLVVQQSEFDPDRAPGGQHTGYAYCHVPAHSDVDMTTQIETQIERFAPGFRDRILARHSTSAAAWPRYNPIMSGGNRWWRSRFISALYAPCSRINPYSTPNPRIFICSASTPPGGGVHGMCGYHAARSVLRRLHQLKPCPLV